MASMLDSGLCPDRGHFAVFLGEALYSHSASFHPGVEMVTEKFNAGVTLPWTTILRGQQKYPWLVTSYYRTWDKPHPDLPLA